MLVALCNRQKYERYIDDGFGVLDVPLMQVHELKSTLKEWNRWLIRRLGECETRRRLESSRAHPKRRFSHFSVFFMRQQQHTECEHTLTLEDISRAQLRTPDHRAAHAAH